MSSESSPKIAKAKSATPPTNPMANFEANCEQLSQIEKQLESSDITLEQSVKLYEQAQKLIEECQSALSQAEMKIKTIRSKADLD